MKSIVFLFIACFMLSACNIPSDHPGGEASIDGSPFGNSQPKNDDHFIIDATEAGILEVQLAALAISKTTSKEVKKYAQILIEDHNIANEELTALAGLKNMILPVSLSDQKQEHFNTLSKKTGSDFDRAYISYMIRDHKNDIEEFTEQAQKGDDPDIKSWAANKVETWEQHLSMAESLDVVIK